MAETKTDHMNRPLTDKACRKGKDRCPGYQRVAGTITPGCVLICWNTGETLPR